MSNPSRTLNIKTNVVKRILKDVHVAHVDIQDAKERLQTRIDNGEDEHEIEHQKFVLKQHLRALPDALNRLQRAAEDLQSIVDNPVYADLPELETAKSVLATVTEVMENERSTDAPKNGHT
ncbi:tubulin specific chaperone cofactor A [Schizosaccharomyces cryophilus OY26]|uniref:Tubulin-specific chaperone A n=1 Tax=Schizosaccharomyces cryophilus (strain OY26 / ATCC MYA-4695 / CBS 11777 / NBRC 106824 / NRRL Y48691) TaxID=653667 RepID=S9VWN6_SCHCR|nr:tubulin specific chaperone cofactor A [Schizosaccharomyces cryophilus OY26]EPY52068.1 tubulin specific chaperone cofactor A [Schizosaccharomyces cryophilus OY26]